MSKKRVIAMIPARLGSQRVPKKNLRLLNGKPLISYAIEAAKASGAFDEIYINSEADIFAELAKEYGVKFYKRPAELSSNTAVNDDFAYDFIKNTMGDIMVQLLPTSPLIAPEEIKGFVDEMINGGYESLVSVNDHQIACLYQRKPVNFSLLEKHKSSQTMVPVQSYATVLMAWTYGSYAGHMEKKGCAYHGADGKTGYFVIKGLSTIDIDNEEDFVLAEVAMKFRNDPSNSEKQFWQPKNGHKTWAEVDVPAILKIDGVAQSDFMQENLPLTNLDRIIAGKDNSRSWCHRLVNTESNSATLISQLPGEGNRLHYHPNWNEWWFIVAGRWQWEIEGQKYIVKKGDMVFIEKNKWHKITAIGDRPAVRLAVSRGDVPHVYREESK
ncbi:MAG: cupin domain-containing protein [Candidatus Margulisiibacteriota bacterium]